MNKAREKEIRESLGVQVSRVINKWLQDDNASVADCTDLFYKAISKGEIPGVGVCEGCAYYQCGKIKEMIDNLGPENLKRFKALFDIKEGKE